MRRHFLQAMLNLRKMNCRRTLAPFNNELDQKNEAAKQEHEENWLYRNGKQ